MPPKKPPIGIMPRYIWIEKRIEDIKTAMKRFSEAEEDIFEEWYVELGQLISELNKPRFKNSTKQLAGNESPKEPLQKLDQEKRNRIKLVVAQFLYCDDCRISNNIRRDEIERRALDFYENRAEFNARVNTLSYQIFEALEIPSGDPEIQFKGFDLSKY